MNELFDMRQRHLRDKFRETGAAMAKIGSPGCKSLTSKRSGGTVGSARTGDGEAALN